MKMKTRNLKIKVITKMQQLKWKKINIFLMILIVQLFSH